MNDWWLKIRRAEKHMIDIKEEARKYASSHPYDFIRIGWPDSKNEIRYRFHITKQPDPMIAVMLGDFIHNLRSALDYIIVACVPKQRRGNAGFPIVHQDIFAKDKNGEFVVKDTNLRENFNTAIDGLHPDARTFVIALQPYNFRNNSFRSILGIISRLENADKHRQLIAIGSGGREFTANFVLPDLPNNPIPYKDTFANDIFFKDNTVILFNLLYNLPRMDGSPVKPSEVEMHFTGTAKILVKITRIGGNQPPTNMFIDDILNMALSDVRDILIKLENFVQ